MVQVHEALSDEDDSIYSDCDDSHSTTLLSMNCEGQKDLDVETIDEILEHGRVTKTLQDYDLEGELFLDSDLEAQKLKEKKLLDEICQLYKPYIISEYLKKLAYINKLFLGSFNQS